jgi:hypothetical protein
MAIKADLNSSYGVVASYHRVTCVSINALIKEITICVASYVSKEKREEGFDPIDSVDITVPSDDYESFLNGSIYSAAYNWLKENVEGFEDAEDD